MKALIELVVGAAIAAGSIVAAILVLGGRFDW